ncbi:MAG: ABC transporter permease, partial [Shimia sp.]|nr:ABC transporter permease [Shimia sp.]
MKLVVQSVLNRRFVVSLTVFAIALSVALILSVERLRDSARTSFANSASGVDLIIAPRGNDVQILLATLFGVGSTGTGMSGDVVALLKDMPGVAWTVPLMQGDNHKGFPVIGTSDAYFEHFKHSRGKALVFA